MSGERASKVLIPPDREQLRVAPDLRVLPARALGHEPDQVQAVTAEGGVVLSLANGPDLDVMGHR